MAEEEKRCQSRERKSGTSEAPSKVSISQFIRFNDEFELEVTEQKYG